MIYYNENDPKAAAWLRELIKQKHIPYGYVDERSITEVRADDLAGYVQCHFFAGIGGWSLALRLAGWPEDKPVWTGSCPCQPFSNAGKKDGTQDERHLWPAFRDIIAQCGVPVVFGEQVASELGRDWLAGIRRDLEGMGYVVGAADLCAACVGAPHIRQRLFWVANSVRERGCRWNGQRGHAVDAVASSVDVWERSQWIDCRDKKRRRVPIEPAFQPLANGVPARVVRLRGYGNAIVPQVAAEFIQASIGAITDTTP